MRRAAIIATTVIVLVLGACTPSPHADSQATSSPHADSQATTSPRVGLQPSDSGTGSAAGRISTISVTPDAAISLKIPGVGTLSGAKGSVTKSGTMKVTAVAGAPALPSGVTVAGEGMDVAVTGTTLAKPLTLTFSNIGSDRDGNVPVVLHVRHDGQWEYKKAAMTGGGLQVATQDFSSIFPAFINPAAWADGLWQHIKSGAAGRTTPLTCTGEPKWLNWSNPSDQVHVCATTNAGRAELQVKSNRGVTLEIHRPGSPQYMWVQDQPNWLRHALGIAFNYDPDTTVLLPAGDTMTIGYGRPLTNQDLNFTVTGRTARATAHTIAQDTLNYVTGLGAGTNAYAFAAYMFVECDTGVSTSQYHFNPGTFADFLICVGSRIEDAVRHPSVVTAFANRFGGGAADAAALRDTIKAAQRQFTLVAFIAPVLQLTFGSALDGVQNLMTQGSSDTFSAALTGSQSTGSTTGGTSPPTSSTPSSGAGTMAAGKGKVYISPCLDLHNGVGRTAPVIGCIPQDTIITIQCTAQGNPVTGTYGTTTLWDRTSFGGNTGYVSDAWVYTGTSGAVAGPCPASAPPAPAPLPVSTPPPASTTAKGTILIDPCLDLHSTAGHASPVIGCIPKGVIIPIECTTQSNSVTGPYGPTTLWDRTNHAGQTGFVSDAWVYTGVSGAVAGPC